MYEPLKVSQISLQSVRGRTTCSFLKYLQSDIAELTTLSQGVHFGHGGIQETFVLKNQTAVWNHLCTLKYYSCSKHSKTTKWLHFNTIYYASLIVCARLKLNSIIRVGFINWWLERGLERGDCNVDCALYNIICPGALVMVVPNGECKSREAPLLGVEQEPREGNGQSRLRSQLNPSLLHPWRGMGRG